MSNTHYHSRAFTSSSGRTFSGTASATAGGEVFLDEPIAASTPDQAFVFTLDVSQCKGLWFKSDVDCTVETNSSSSAVNVFTLVAGVPFSWMYGGPALRDTAGTAVTVDITQIFVTVAGATAGTFQAAVLYDPTI